MLLVALALVAVAAVGTAVVLTRDPARQAITLSAFGLSLALLFALAGQGGEVGRLRVGVLGDSQLAVGGQYAIEKAAHPCDQAAPGDFEFGSGHGGGRIGEAHAGYLAQPQGLVHNALAGIFADGVVGDELRSGLRGRALTRLVLEPVWLGI